MLKFGRLVNLEALQTLSVNTNLEELKMKMMEKEQTHAAELRKWEVRLVLNHIVTQPGGLQV